MIENHENTADDEVEPQGKIFFRGIWWDSSWAQNWDLYDDHDYRRCYDESRQKVRTLKKKRSLIIRGKNANHTQAETFIIIRRKKKISN